jgi:hypothetical protein
VGNPFERLAAIDIPVAVILRMLTGTVLHRRIQRIERSAGIELRKQCAVWRQPPEERIFRRFDSLSR